MKVKVNFQATYRNQVANNARALSDTITMHIIYLTYLQQDEARRKYWIDELATKIASVRAKIKGGMKFSYSWFFEPNVEFEADDVKRYLKGMNSEHQAICPDVDDFEPAITNFYNLKDELIIQSKGKVLDYNKIRQIIEQEVKHA